MDILDLLDRAKARLKVGSDRQLAEALGVYSSNLVQWRRREKLPNDERMLRICLAANIAPEVGLLHLNMWRSRGDVRATYRVICKILDSNAYLSARDEKATERAANKSAASI